MQSILISVPLEKSHFPLKIWRPSEPQREDFAPILSERKLQPFVLTETQGTATRYIVLKFVLVLAQCLKTMKQCVSSNSEGLNDGVNFLKFEG